MVRVVETLVPEEVQADPEAYQEIAEEHHDELECISAELYWNRTVRKKFVRKDERSSAPCIAPAPVPTLPGTLIGSRLAAQIIADKHCDHLPHYRQSQRLKRRFGAEISRSTLNGWAMAAAAHLSPIGEAIRAELLETRVLQVDETPIKYLDPGRGKTAQGYLWVYHDPTRGTVLYDWQLGRGAECLEKMLWDFSGYLQCDGYPVYDKFAARRDAIILAACLAHIRRNFYDAREGCSAAAYILRLILELYRIERQLRRTGTFPACRALVRKSRAGPIVKELRRTILRQRQCGGHLPKSKMGKALGYALGQWEQFERYLEEGALEIDNNLVENAVRPTKLGAKNYLFFGSAEAGKPNALLYTLIENAKRQGLDPEKYLEEAIRRLPENASPEEAAALTPAQIAGEHAAKVEVARENAA